MRISDLSSDVCSSDLHLMALVQLRPLDITDAILASVVPAATFHLLRLVRDHFRCEPLVVGAPGVELGLAVLIEDRKRIVAGKSVSVRVDLGGGRIINKK